MCGLGFASISVRHGGSDGGTVGFGARWELEARAILRCVLGIGRNKSTQIVSIFRLIVGYLDEDLEEIFSNARQVIVGWFYGNFTKLVGGLFEHT